MNRTRTLGLIAALVASPALGAPIPREGSGARRAAMNAMEAAPLPRDAFDSLDAWLGMDALRVRHLRGVVTVIVTTDVAEPDSIGFTKELSEMAARQGGVAVIAIHPETGWDRFEILHDAGMIKVPGARDTGDALRTLLHADESGDLFIFDKAGHLRYADVEPIALERAVAELLEETAEHAASEADRRAEMIEAGGNPYGPVRAERIELPSPQDMTSGMLVDRLYDDARWPAHNTEFKANDLQGQPMPSLGDLTWISERYTDHVDKAVVLFFWRTTSRPCVRAMPALQALQKTYHRNMIVIAVGGAGEEELRVRDWVKDKGEHLGYAYEPRRRLLRAFGPEFIPFAVVASSDGVVRWSGNPLDDDFIQIVHDVMEADPLARARRGDLRLRADDVKYIPAAGSGDLDWPAACPDRSRHSEQDLHDTVLEDPFADFEWIDGSPAPETEGKVTILAFWATWSNQCKRFMPRLEAIQRQHAGDVVAVAISGMGEDDRGSVENHLAEHPSHCRQAIHEEQVLYDSIGIEGVPHVVIMSSDGIVRWHGVPNATADFEAIVEKVIEADRGLRDITGP